jgi:hypothetical protein
MRVLSITYAFTFEAHTHAIIETDEGEILLHAEGLKRVLVWGGFVFLNPRSKFADYEIHVPPKWCGNDSRMVLRGGFTTNPLLVKIAQDFMEAICTGDYDDGPQPIPTEPPMIVNKTSPPRQFRHSIIWPVDSAQTLSRRDWEWLQREREPAMCTKGPAPGTWEE